MWVYMRQNEGRSSGAAKSFMSRGEGYKTASPERGNTKREEQGDNVVRDLNTLD